MALIPIPEVGEFLGEVPLVGGLFKSLFGGGDNVSDAEEQQRLLFKELAEQYEAQQEPTRQARMQALNQTMGLFQPAAQAFEKWYGYNPMGEELQDPIEAQKTRRKQAGEQKRKK